MVERSDIRTRGQRHTRSRLWLVGVAMNDPPSALLIILVLVLLVAAFRCQ